MDKIGIFITLLGGAVGYLLVDRYILKMRIKDLEDEINELENK